MPKLKPIKLIKPHNIVSREVKEEDIPRVLRHAKAMERLCNEPHGIYYSGALAIAHPQVVKNDPLRFFVLRTGDIIINPVIIRHTGTTIDSEEGCMSFPRRAETIVQRWNKCEVQYQAIIKEGDKYILAPKQDEHLESKISKVFQHEIDHLNAIYIYSYEK